MKIIALFAILTLMGCQTTTGINSPSSSSIYPNGLPAAITDSAEYARILNQIDANGDKSITAAEIRASGLDPGKSILFSQTNTVSDGQTPEKYIELYDADYDQTLSPLELKNYVYVFIFKNADTNKDGILQKEELLSSKTSDSAFAFMDTNKDGKISFEEWATVGERMQQETSD
jgi:Ca2+-binding EF-hand superfamily protein